VLRIGQEIKSEHLHRCTLLLRPSIVEQILGDALMALAVGHLTRMVRAVPATDLPGPGHSHAGGFSTPFTRAIEVVTNAVVKNHHIYHERRGIFRVGLTPDAMRAYLVVRLDVDQVYNHGCIF
jgi:hypothetical protein